MPDLNYLAVLVAAFAFFSLGGIWFSPPLFYKPWKAACGLTDADLQSRNTNLVLAAAFLYSIMMALILALLLAGPATTLYSGALLGAAFGAVSFLGIAMLAHFEKHGWVYILINGGYLLLGMPLMGAIVGVWR